MKQTAVKLSDLIVSVPSEAVKILGTEQFVGWNKLSAVPACGSYHRFSPIPAGTALSLLRPTKKNSQPLLARYVLLAHCRVRCSLGRDQLSFIYSCIELFHCPQHLIQLSADDACPTVVSGFIQMKFIFHEKLTAWSSGWVKVSVGCCNEVGVRRGKRLLRATVNSRRGSLAKLRIAFRSA